MRIRGRTAVLVVLAGVLDMAANALFLLAAQQGQLAITGILASLYPVSTVVLAQVVLRERLVATQAAGPAAARAGLVLIAPPALGPPQGGRHPTPRSPRRPRLRSVGLPSP